MYASPYRRAQQTLGAIFEATDGAELPAGVYERTRAYGRSTTATETSKQQERLRETHGWFYYRYEGGESPADCYDRVSGFLESLMRQVERKAATRVLVVTHGLALRCFVMRFLHLTVAEFETLQNPANGAVVTLAPPDLLAGLPGPKLVRRRFGVAGLRFYDGATS